MSEYFLVGDKVIVSGRTYHDPSTQGVVKETFDNYPHGQLLIIETEYKDWNGEMHKSTMKPIPARKVSKMP